MSGVVLMRLQLVSTVVMVKPCTWFCTWFFMESQLPFLQTPTKEIRALFSLRADNLYRQHQVEKQLPGRRDSKFAN